MRVYQKNNTHSMALIGRRSLSIFACVTSLFFTHDSAAVTEEQAKRIYERLTGTAPSTSMLTSLLPMNGEAAAEHIIDTDDNFYRVTVKNWVAPWTNRDQDVFVDLNDYIATVMGYIHEERDFRGILYDDVIYTFAGISPAYANDNNSHYQNAEASDPQTVTLRSALTNSTQSSVNGLPTDATAGVLTTRAAAEAFYVDGTNRAMFRYTLVNHLCMDLEQLQDASLPPDRIRQDVSRSPGGDSRVFVNTCVTCHAGMDPLAQAFAYYDYDNDGITDEEGNQVVAATNQMLFNRIGDIDIDEKTNESTGTRVQRKYHINENTFPSGFVTPDDRWDNYWRGTANDYLGWDSTLPGFGNGAKSLGQELAHSQQFAQCQVEKVFKAVCLRDPISTADRAEVTTIVNSVHDTTNNLPTSPLNLKSVFAQTADYCKGS